MTTLFVTIYLLFSFGTTVVFADYFSEELPRMGTWKRLFAALVVGLLWPLALAVRIMAVVLR